MSQAYLRDIETGEIHEFLQDSPEFRAALAEKHETGDGRVYPKFEQQGDHFVRRVDGGEVRETDLGNAYKPTGVVDPSLAGVGPDPHPEQSLTESEREAGIESWEAKAEQLGFTRGEDEQKKLDEGLAKAGTTSSVTTDVPVGSGAGSGQAPAVPVQLQEGDGSAAPASSASDSSSSKSGSSGSSSGSSGSSGSGSASGSGSTSA